MKHILTILFFLINYKYQLAHQLCKTCPSQELFPEQWRCMADLVCKTNSTMECGENKPILLIGEEGFGKTKVLLALKNLYQQRPEYSVTYKHFCREREIINSTSIAESISSQLLDTAQPKGHEGILHRKLTRKVGLDYILTKLRDFNSLKRYIIIIDGESKLGGDDLSSDLSTWIPATLPSNITLIISASSFSHISLNAFQICCSGRLSVHTQKIYVSKVLQLDILCGKSLIHGTSSSHQQFITAQNVSCLRLACILLQNNLSLYSKLVGEEKDLSVNLISGVTAYFEHLEEKYGNDLLGNIFLLLLIPNVPIGQVEFIDLFDFAFSHSRIITQDTWSKLFFDLNPLLLESSNESWLLHQHGWIRRYIRQRYSLNDQHLQSMTKAVGEWLLYCLDRTCKARFVVEAFACFSLTKSFDLMIRLLSKPKAYILLAQEGCEYIYFNYYNACRHILPDGLSISLPEDETDNDGYIHTINLLNELGMYQRAWEIISNRLKSTTRSLYHSVGSVTTWYEYYVFGCLMSNLYRYDRALHFLRRAFEIQQRGLGPYQREISYCILEKIGQVFMLSGKFHKALDHSIETHTFVQSNFDAKNVINAFSFIQLAYACQGLSRFDEALTMLKSGLELARQMISEDQPLIGQYHYLLSDVFKELKCYEEAVESIGHGILIFSKIASLSADVAQGHQKKAIVFRHMRRYSDSLSHFQIALSIYSAVNMSQTGMVALVYKDIGGLLEEQGSMEQALEKYLESMSIFDKANNKCAHTAADIIFSVSNIHWIQKRHEFSMSFLLKCSDLPLSSYERIQTVRERLTLLGHEFEEDEKYDESLLCFLASLKIGMSHIGGDSPDTIRSLLDVSMAHTHLNRYDDAYMYLLTAKALQENKLGAHHLDIAATHRLMADIDLKTLRIDSAICHLSSSVSIELSSMDPNHLEIAMLYAKLAELNEGQKRLEVSVDLYQSALRHYKKLPDDHRVTVGRIMQKIDNLFKDLKDDMLNVCRQFATSKNAALLRLPSNTYSLRDIQDYAERLETGQRFEEARNCYNSLLVIQLRLFGEKHIDVANSYNSIGLTFKKEQKYEDALKNYSKALEIQVSILGRNHLHVAVTYNNIAMVYRKLCRYEEALGAMTMSMHILQQNGQASQEDAAKLQHNIDQVRKEAKGTPCLEPDDSKIHCCAIS
eukprot:TRINITY_DN5642_c0_g1_i6.p1 TRINITY_DN5642_c0_g1~~TRINITY_DN5642_c0_g1_i6.p1  ORF type:complete len:1172 (+),score=155.35 TRINITY_DN5642_c0_g1_i6:506-4021(+)